ncbi:hypothetical protein [Parapedobacter sp. 2B3]|uniref:hypothetical protein n=1 Tax=Parapedobacter sp. 2B3 TaxID=3342381 RepID=UPI0035B5F01D
MDFVGDVIIGYTKDSDGKFLLWVKDGKLRRSSLTPYYKLPKDANYAALHKVSWFLKRCGINFEGLDDSKETVSNTVADPKQYECLVDKVRKFLESLVDMQIFL